jgi:hypothetical protein
MPSLAPGKSKQAMTRFSDPLTNRLAGFLTEIGIEVVAADLPDTFLPGLALDGGRLLVDEQRLDYPGDMLHEAGHIAVAPGWARPQLTGDIDVPGLDTGDLEWAAIPWSYAAALAAGIDPRLVFHEGGYHGKSAGLLSNFELGVPIGLHHLVAAGMTATGPQAEELGAEPYPHMLRWLRE